ncbi:MAG: Uncharacterized protein G01um101448_871 [Parcubacteria group bacterium Gr01-1014_48]|nr:MAG: Uncharacterized protein Greene041614_1198 [Parcubacteria group bacterium Greene0416_14]TSC72970.1 MAG: Uncharacterized protein G01um101448_871 [Parcubacteria group bacterium Gr01-1014_48]TSC99090.1 MAG: Uncharacterized protein Greene101415_1194 [Parcubacteria group bacterium Greene1014_15]TSD06975.1 MAG: Uncharacterized protein Greene07144_1050 [Parcubacteria group bacterium Greene0714_4]
MKKYFLVTFGLFALPMLANAQTLASLITKVTEAINLLIPLAIGLALVIFLFGVIKYITAGGDEEGRKSGRQFMLWGIIGLFVMVAVWGLVAVIANTTGITVGGGSPGIPTAP